MTYTTGNLSYKLRLFKELFEAHFSSIENKAEAFQEAIRDEHGSKSELIATVPKLMNSISDPITLGEEFLNLVVDTLDNSIDYRQLDNIRKLKKKSPELYEEFCSLLNEMLRSKGEEDEVFEVMHQKIVAYHDSSANTRFRATLFHLLLVALACRNDSKTIYGAVEFFKTILLFFYGKTGFSKNDKEIVHNFQLVNNIVTKLRTKMTNNWGWKPNDNTEVHSALWIIMKNDKKVKSYNKTKNNFAKTNKEIAREFEKQVEKLPADAGKDVTVTQRCGQALLRKALLSLNNNRCMLTGIDNVELLRVSHIKPWKDCVSKWERVDVNNGFLLSALWDLAFDRGLITFDDNGKLRLSIKLKKSSRTFLTHKSPLVLNKEQRKYLEWHRKHVFKTSKKKSNASETS